MRKRCKIPYRSFAALFECFAAGLQIWSWQPEKLRCRQEAVNQALKEADE